MGDEPNLDEFAAYHSAREEWEAVDWHRWRALRVELAKYGVTRLWLEGDELLIANTGTPVRFQPAEGHTTLDAILWFVQAEESRRKKRDR